MLLRISACGALMVAGLGLAQAQTVAPAQSPAAFAACPSQQELEQVLGSKGRFVPDSCRQLSITPVQSPQGTACVLNFDAGKDPGILDRLANATIPTQWWVACENLKAP